MLLLGIETATRRVGVVLASDEGMLGARRAGRVRRRGRASPRRTARAGDRVLLRRRSARRSTTSPRSRSASVPGMFTGLRVGVTTAKVLAQALRVPMIPMPSLDLLAYPLRHARGLVVRAIDARRNELYYALYRPVPGGVQRASEYEVGSRRRPRGRARSARRGSAAVRRRRAARTPRSFARRRARRARRARARGAEPGRAGRSSRSAGTSARSSAAPTTCCRCTCARATPSSPGTGRAADVATARKLIEHRSRCTSRRCAGATCARCCGSRRRCTPRRGRTACS